jgi:hypothetical protein
VEHAKRQFKSRGINAAARRRRQEFVAGAEMRRAGPSVYNQTDGG